METKDARRRRKLQMLIDATEGGLDAIAIVSGKSPGYLRQILDGALLPVKKDGTRSARALGDNAAEAIEDGRALGRGWFDSDKPVPQPTTTHQVQQTVVPFNADSWPFPKITKTEYFGVLHFTDRDAVEATALALLLARTSNSKQSQHAPNGTTA